MPRTPDRFPGERQDEGLVLFDNAAAGDPTVTGGLRYITDRFRFRDNLGVYTGRTVYVSASSDPTATDDVDNGYNEGMLWLNLSTGVTYICLDETAASAVWVILGLPPATEVGQHLISFDGSTFERAQPVVSPDDGWLSNCDGELLVEGLEP